MRGCILLNHPGAAEKTGETDRHLAHDIVEDGRG